MDPKSFIGQPRITDYSFRLADSIQKSTDVSAVDLRALYNYHRDNALYPQSNWQPHRLCLMSSIALRLKDNTMAQECHRLCIKWIRDSDCKCCAAKSQDFHWRDSCEYVVYGWWALAQALVYLQPITKASYKHLFNNYFAWLDVYKQGKAVHIEFMNSQIKGDVKKPHYGLQFDPAYNDNLMRVYSRLTK